MPGSNSRVILMSSHDYDHMTVFCFGWEYYPNDVFDATLFKIMTLKTLFGQQPLQKQNTLCRGLQNARSTTCSWTPPFTLTHEQHSSLLFFFLVDCYMVPCHLLWFSRLENKLTLFTCRCVPKDKFPHPFFSGHKSDDIMIFLGVFIV